MESTESMPPYWDIPFELYDRIRQEVDPISSARLIDSMCSYYFMKIEPVDLTAEELKAFESVRMEIDTMREAMLRDGSRT